MFNHILFIYFFLFLHTNNVFLACNLSLICLWFLFVEDRLDFREFYGRDDTVYYLFVQNN